MQMPPNLSGMSVPGSITFQWINLWAEMTLPPEQLQHKLLPTTESPGFPPQGLLPLTGTPASRLPGFPEPHTEEETASC